MRKQLVFVVLCLAACGKKKDAAPSSGSGSSETPPANGSGSATASNPGSGSSTATPPAGSGSGSAMSGCAAPPEDFTGSYTIPKDCKLKLTDNLKVADGSSLTIEAGAKVSFAKGTRIENNGKLVIAGTAEAPVVLTSADESPNPGDWDGIALLETTHAGTSIDHAKIEYAGKNGPWGSQAIHLIGELPPNRVSITNTEITHATGGGITIDNDKTLPTKLEGNTFTDTDKVSIAAPADVWGAIGPNKNGDQAAHVTTSALTKTATWPKLDGTLVIDKNLEIGSKDAPVLTLPEGATIKVDKGASIRIGSDEGGGLVAVKVTFTSAAVTPDAGDWQGFSIAEKATKTNIDGCTLEFAGGNGSWGSSPIVIEPPVDKIAGRVTIKNVTMKKCANPGIVAPENKCGPYGDAASGNKVDGGQPICKS